MEVRVRVLGPLVVETADGVLVVPPRRERAVLAVLALHEGAVVDDDVLADGVFGATLPARPQHALATLVLRLRHRLGVGVVGRSDGGYRLDTALVAIDAVELERAVRSDEGVAEALRQWRGPPYPELDGWPLAEAARARLVELHDHAEEELAERALAAGRAGVLVGDVEALVAAAPFRERRWALLIRCLDAAGRQAEALAAFQRARALLVDELGIEPGPALVAAERAVLARDPPVAAPPALARSSLPVPLTSFLGRADEVRALAELVSTQRLVTLTGSGGVGKSRLALRVAGDVLDVHPRGVWWVELAGATTSAAVVAAMAAGAGVVLQPGETAEKQLVAALGGSDRGLLVVDNCEQVVDVVAEVVHGLLARCPNLAVLATSREPLRVPGERLWRVRSLTAPRHDEPVTAAGVLGFEAAELFVERARDAQPGFHVDDHAASLIAAICAQLDGIPLAVELAAARLRTMTLERIAAGLSDAFSLLTGGPRTALARHRTLAASIAWSHDLLDPIDQVVLRRLSVCPTGFDLDAARAIAADGVHVMAGDVDASVGRLVDRSLVEYDAATGAYRIIETVRQHGRDRLRDHDELDATHGRHARYWADRAIASNPIVTEPVASDHRYDPVRLAGMLTDLFTMLDWAMEHDVDLADRVLAASSPQLFGLGRWPDLPRICDWLLADRRRGPHWPAAVAAVGLAGVLVGRSDVLGLTDEALTLARAANDERAVQQLSVGPAYHRCALGDLEPARRLVAACRASGNHLGGFQIAIGLADALASLGQRDELTTLIATSDELATAAGIDTCDTNLGTVRIAAHHLAGDLTAPLVLLPERPHSWEAISGGCAAVAARVAVSRDDLAFLERAAALLGPADVVGGDAPVRIVEWARAVLVADRHAAIDAAIAAADATTSSALHRGRVLTDLAATFATAQRWNDATSALAELDALLGSINERAPLWRARAGIVAARLALAAGDPTATDTARAALERATDDGLRLEQIDAIETIAVGAHAGHRHDTAAWLLAAATAARQRLGYHGRLTTPASPVLVGELATTQPTAWMAGTATPLEQAARRAAAAQPATRRSRKA